MIYLQLFLSFFKIGALTFGGGYAMIPLIQDTVLSNNWLTEEEILNFIAVSESTPGPIAVNMATFIGSSQAGFLGAFLATLGVVLPSFIIILIISAFIKNFLRYKGVQSALSAIRPVVVGLIFATAITTLLATVFSLQSVYSYQGVDFLGLILIGILSVFSFVFYRFKKKTPSPILIILLSALYGIIAYSLF